MKYDSIILFSLLVYISIFVMFCNCNKESVSPLCSYTAQGAQNYIWDIVTDTTHLRNQSLFFSFPYPTANPDSLQVDLNDYLNGDGVVSASIDVNRTYALTIDSTLMNFDSLLFSGDVNGNNIQAIVFNQNCE
jgi:hypothetical protein